MGQNLHFLAKRLHELGVSEFSLLSLDGVNGNDYLEAWYGLPTIKKVNALNPAPGWNVVSPTIDTIDKFYRPYVLHGCTGLIPWYDEQIVPMEHVGPLKLYYIPPDYPNRALNEDECNKAPSQSQAPPAASDR